MITRRHFFQYGGAAGAALLIGIAAKKYALTNNVGTDTYKIFDVLVNHMFNDADGYVTSKLNVIGYFKGVLSDRRIDIEEREHLINGTRWLNETANEEFNRNFVQLDHEQIETLLKKISMLRWGDRWLYRVMSYYFETVFSDPIYGGNVDGAGWKWLAYEPGFPRPNEVAI